KAGEPPVFTGEVALVTGAASGIGRATVEALRRRGAAVVGLHLDAKVEALFPGPSYLGLRCDVTDESQGRCALDRPREAFGGLDMAVLNAGVFPAGCKLADLPAEEWSRVLRINLDANVALLRLCHPFLKLSPQGGRVVAVGSKNVPAPGPGAA